MGPVVRPQYRRIGCDRSLRRQPNELAPVERAVSLELLVR